jgi:hypothetical protein
MYWFGGMVALMAGTIAIKAIKIVAIAPIL